MVWICAITSFTLLGSWYVRKWQSADLLIALYVTFVIVAQILATKVAVFNLSFRTFTAPAGVLVFSITYLLTDIVNEKFGRRATQKMILIAFATQVAMVVFFWLGVKLPPAPFWQLQAPWQQLFGLVPRITLASWAAFLLSENFDAWVYNFMKQKTGRRHLWMRNSFSSIPALLLDSLIFVSLAFWGVLPVWPLILGQTVLKWLVGLVNIPFMYLNRRLLGTEPWP